jgi:NAD(P)H-flavin reductase
MAPPRKVKAVVIGMKRYIDNITWYRLKPEFLCRFKPGQFLHLALASYDASYNWPESRVFSIANAPGKEYIDILVSPKGRYTQRMIKELASGTQVWLKLPYGTFNFDASVDKDVVLIAGGTGISPFISFLEYIMENQVNYHSIYLFYGVRRPDLIIFENNIENYRQKIKEFQCRIFCEKIINQSYISFDQGILPVNKIVRNTSLFPSPVYYLSGPKVMIETFNSELKEQGIKGENIFYDKWE